MELLQFFIMGDSSVQDYSRVSGKRSRWTNIQVLSLHIISCWTVVKTNTTELRGVGGSSIQPQRQPVLIITSARFIVSHLKTNCPRGGQNCGSSKMSPMGEGPPALEAIQMSNSCLTTERPLRVQKQKTSQTPEL